MSSAARVRPIAAAYTCAFGAAGLGTYTLVKPTLTECGSFPHKNASFKVLPNTTKPKSHKLSTQFVTADFMIELPSLGSSINPNVGGIMSVQHAMSESKELKSQTLADYDFSNGFQFVTTDGVVH